MVDKNWGKFIVVEGIDGAGSSTQTMMIAEFLRARGVEVLETKEPTGNTHHENCIGELIRQILREDKELTIPNPDPAGKPEIDGFALQLLYTADRQNHVKNHIEPALSRSCYVVSDRFADSTRAYSFVSFGAHDIRYHHLDNLNSSFVVPDLTIYLDIDVDTALRRITQDKSRKGRELYETKERLSKVLKGYEYVLRSQNKRTIVVVNARLSVNRVFAQIRPHLERLLV